MWTRSYWVLITYVKRPLSWLFALAILLCMVVPCFLIDDKVRSVSHDVIYGDAIRTFEQLDAVLASDPAQPIDLDYGQLFSLASQKFFSDSRSETRHIGPDEHALIHASLVRVEGLKHVVAMNAGWAVDPSTIHRIAKFKTLKRLSIIADLGYQSLDLRPLSNLVELEELQLGVINRVDSLKPLGDLPRLHVLGIVYAMILNKDGLDDIANLPHLQVLSLPDLRVFPGLQDTVGKLKQSKTLQQIHYGVSWDDADALADVQSRVGSIRVAPSKIRGARHVVLFFALLAVAAIGFPTMQLAGQLSLPSSYLAPQYRLPHYLVAGVMIATLILGAIVGLVYVGANPLTAASLMLFAGGLNFWAATRVPSKGHVVTKTGFVNLLIALPIGAAPYFVLASGIFRPMWIEHYLMSGQVVIPVACLVIAAWLGWLGYRNLDSRLRTRAELGLPVVLSFRDLQAQSVDWANTPTSVLPGNRPSPMGMKLPVVARTALAVTVLAMPLRALGYDDLGQMALMTCLGAAFLCVCLTGIKWWQEMPYFAATMIRPPMRMGHINRLMQEVRSDMVGFMPLWLASVLAIGLLGPWQFEGVGIRLFHSLVAVASVTLAIYAALLWTLMIRSVIGVAIVFFICYLTCAVMMMEIVVLDHFASPLLSVITILLSGIAMAALSVIAIRFARKQLESIEWARFR